MGVHLLDARHQDTALVRLIAQVWEMAHQERLDYCVDQPLAFGQAHEVAAADGRRRGLLGRMDLLLDAKVRVRLRLAAEILLEAPHERAVHLDAIVQAPLLLFRKVIDALLKQLVCGEGCSALTLLLGCGALLLCTIVILEKSKVVFYASQDRPLVLLALGRVAVLGLGATPVLRCCGLG